MKLNEILKYPYINREEASGTRKETERILLEAKIPPQKLNVVLELGSTQAVITAVSEGKGISIISSIAARKAEKSGLIKTVKISATQKLYENFTCYAKRRNRIKHVNSSGNSAKKWKQAFLRYAIIFKYFVHN